MFRPLLQLQSRRPAGSAADLAKLVVVQGGVYRVMDKAGQEVDLVVKVRSASPSTATTGTYAAALTLGLSHKGSRLSAPAADAGGAQACTARGG